MKEKYTINKKNAFIGMIIVMLVSMIIGNILYLNPLVAGIYKKHANHPSVKNMNEFGGIINWILLTLLFGIFYDVLIIGIYILFYESIPKEKWQKGLIYGTIIAFIKAVPEAFNQYMIFNYPTILILIQLFNTMIGIILSGIILAVVFDKLKVFEYCKVEV